MLVDHYDRGAWHVEQCARRRRPTTVQHAVAHGAEAPIGRRSLVGGRTWLDARDVEPGDPHPRRRGTCPRASRAATSTTTLYLVNPEGGRYALTTFPARGDGPKPASGRLVRRWQPRPVLRSSRQGPDGDRGRPPHRYADHIHGQGRLQHHASLHPPQGQSGAAVQVQRRRRPTVAQAGRPCRKRSADVPGGAIRKQVRAGFPLDPRWHTAGDRHRNRRPRRHGQRRERHQDAAGPGSGVLHTDPLVG